MELTFLDRLINDQRTEFLARAPGTHREVDWTGQLSPERILAVTGIRRAGKSTLLRQIAEKRGEDFVYMNFDDIRLSGFSGGDYETLLSILSLAREGTVFLFDEIQMAPSWERFARRMHDIGRTLVITGSNSSILSDDLGSHLTGRYLVRDIYPFSFREYLVHRGCLPDEPRTTAKASLLLKHGIDYLEKGGFPEYLGNPRRELLENIFRDIIVRDVIARHGIQEKQGIRDLALFLVSNAGARISYGKLASNLGFRSATSVKDYLGYMEDVYLLFQLRRFDWSLKKSMLSPRKVYPVDNGLSGAVAFRTSPDYGRRLETAVFIDLKRRGQVWYFSGKRECDFVTRSDTGYRCIQVCWHLDGDNRARELAGLTEAMEFFEESNGTIVTLDQEDSISTGQGQLIEVIPYWRWALDL